MTDIFFNWQESLVTKTFIVCKWLQLTEKFTPLSRINIDWNIMYATKIVRDALIHLQKGEF